MTPRLLARPLVATVTRGHCVGVSDQHQPPPAQPSHHHGVLLDQHTRLPLGLVIGFLGTAITIGAIAGTANYRVGLAEQQISDMTRAKAEAATTLHAHELRIQRVEDSMGFIKASLGRIEAKLEDGGGK